jgi:hypothetical protein
MKMHKEKMSIDPEYRPIGINQKLDKIDNKLNSLTSKEEKKALKKFKMPFGVKRQLKNLSKRNQILVILLKSNKTAEPIITDIKNDFIVIKGIPHNCSMDFVFLWKGKYPCIVLPEWDLNPIGTEDYYKAVEDKRVAAPVAIVMRMIKEGQELVGKENKMGAKAWVIGGLVVIALLYILFQPGP